MGFHIRPLLFAAPLLLAAPVHAQQAEQPGGAFQLPSTTPPPASNPNQQGPELDVFRDPVTPRATPPVVAPTVTPPPITVQPTPAPTQQQPSRPRPPATPTPAQAERPAPTPAQPRPAPEPATTPAPPSDDAAANDSAPAEPPVAPTANITQTPEPAATPAPTPAAQEEEGLSLPWIIGGLFALAIVAAALLLRRRRPTAQQAAEPVAPPTPAPKPQPPAPTPPPPPPAPELVAASTAPTPADANRPWLDMDLGVTQARYSMMGVTISYALILHNRGDRPAQDVLVRGILGNGGAQQQAVLQGFFTGADGLPLHSAVSIAPGETIQLAGELRLSPDQIVPVEMGQRSLLIPLAAFDVAYRWGQQEGEADGPDIEGSGRTARAFIVGQEQEPPADRLAPLRLDQGPRQYRRPAARAAAELTPA